MKTLKVTEVATYEFEVPDDFPARTYSAEEFFCNLSNPRGDAEQLTVTERYFAMEDENGESIELDAAEPDGSALVWTGHAPGAPCPVPESTKVYIKMVCGLESSRPLPAKVYHWRRIEDAPGDEIIAWARAQDQT